jgi:hypothetical protein
MIHGGEEMSKHSSGWSRKFDEPIPLPSGRKLVTLRDAADYITGLPKTESDLPEWQAAIEVLMLVSRSGPTMMARIRVMKALNRHVERVFNPEPRIPIGGNESSNQTCNGPFVPCAPPLVGISALRFSSAHMKRMSATVLYPALREPPTALSIASNSASCCNGFRRLATSPL